jgi:hypothetical protein
VTSFAGLDVIFLTATYFIRTLIVKQDSPIDSLAIFIDECPLLAEIRLPVRKAERLE